MSENKSDIQNLKVIELLYLRRQNNHKVILPTILAIGIVSILLVIGTTVWIGRTTPLNNYPIPAIQWILMWSIAAIFIFILASYCVFRHAKINNHSVSTDQLKHISKTLIPCLLYGFISGITICLYDIKFLPFTAATWISCYGLALLSIRLYTTRSARFLGILMLALGLACIWVSLRTQNLIHPIHLANFFMALGFGMLHLIVAFGSIIFSRIEC